jgi:hypothetical protein
MNARTLTRVKKNVYRINHPQTNAVLTRHGGLASPRLIGLCFAAAGILGTQSIERDIEFRRGNNSRKWYFEIT